MITTAKPLGTTHPRTHRQHAADPARTASAAHLPGIQILGKAEWTNPGGSVKDRAASAIVPDAQTRGLLTASHGLLDATSGNTGIAYAMLGAALGFPVTLCMPSNVSPERKHYPRRLRRRGRLDRPRRRLRRRHPQGPRAGRRRARPLLLRRPVLQRRELAAHYRTTGNEIWEQTEGQVTHFVAGLGTSGTFMGTTRRLQRAQPRDPLHLHAARLALQRPRRPEAHGHRHRAAHLRPRARRREHRDGDRDTPIAMAQSLARNQGILVGISAAAAVATALQIAEQEAQAGREAVIVTILPDSADKYMSERFWQEE